MPKFSASGHDRLTHFNAASPLNCKASHRIDAILRKLMIWLHPRPEMVEPVTQLLVQTQR